jgi:hypothetical protein
MKNRLVFKTAVFIVTLPGLNLQLHATEPGCTEISLIAAIARAKTPSDLKLRKQNAGDGYRAQLIYAVRMFEIDPDSRTSAESLLKLLPKDRLSPEQDVCLDLVHLEACPSGGIPDSDLEPLFKLQPRLPRDAARAVILVPSMMFDYISYASISVGDPHSDHAIQMKKPCEKMHAQFTAAFGKLSEKDQSWFRTKVFNPDGCRIMAFPEQ